MRNLPSDKRLKFRRMVIAFGFAVTTATALAASPALADSDDWRNGRHEWRERHESRENRWNDERREGRENHWNYGWGYVEPPPAVVYGPGPGINFDVNIR